MFSLLKKLSIIFVLLFSSVGYSHEGFLTQNIDIPLMNGLNVNAADQMDFDTPSGQLLVLEGSSKTKTAEEVLSFYDGILPQMGWVKMSKGVFSRQQDTLSISILKNGKPSKVRFDISFTNQD